MESSVLIGLADDPGLAFLNSTATESRGKLELIGDGTAYLSWLAQSGLIDAVDPAVIVSRFSAAELDTAAEQAIQLREWLRPLIAAWASDGSLGEPLIERLNAVLRTDRWSEQVHRSAEDGPIRLERLRHWQDAVQLLAPPAAAVARLLTGADPHLVRQCEGPTCTLWFYDRTKSHQRRWCSMAACGNRAKAQAHRARTRER